MFDCVWLIVVQMFSPGICIATPTLKDYCIMLGLGRVCLYVLCVHFIHAHWISVCECVCS